MLAVGALADDDTVGHMAPPSIGGTNCDEPLDELVV